MTVVVVLMAALTTGFPGAGVMRAEAQVKGALKGDNPQTQGGILVFGSEERRSLNDSSFVQTVALEEYVGQPLKALQLQILSQGGIRLRSVERGPDIRQASEWNFSHVIARGANGADTARVVIFGLGPTTLPVRPSSVLLRVTYEVTSSGDAGTPMLSLSGVLGALSRGENANVSAGPPRMMSFNKERRK